MIKTKQAKNITEQCVAPDGYIVVNVLSWHEHDTPYYDLCPYVLKTDGHEIQDNKGGVIFENFWQGSKVYPIVKPIEVYPHHTFKGNKKYLWWSYDKEETHIDDNGDVKKEYFNWKKSLFDCAKPVRYPNSYALKHTCKFTLLVKKDGTQEKLNYLEARKQLYCNEYMRLVRTKSSYKKLLNMLLEGKKLCIFEVDVPAVTKKGVHGKYAKDGNVFKASLKKINKLLNDTSEPFGHGLCLAKALLEDYQNAQLSDSD